LNLKCDPDEAHALRDIFDAVIPGYHMNKRLWNTVILDGSVPRGEIERMIDNSFLLVVQKMTKKQREAIMVHL
jgi:predicted DNA-binding protein (MmcQ/YjbR family)